MSTASSRGLFGGAISVELPSEVIDASDLRQVPDTQEVFLYPDSGVSIIVEVLERVDLAGANDAAKFHFESLAHDNSAEEHKVHDITVASTDNNSPTPSPILLYGEQSIRKFNSHVPDQIRILLAVYRVVDKNVDLVMSMNAPMKSASGDAINEDQWVAAKEAFAVAARSLRIVDFGLFA